VLVKANGLVMYTQPEEEHTGKYKDVPVGSLPAFDYHKQEFIDLSVEFDDKRLSFTAKSNAGSVVHAVPAAKMPYVYGSGKVRVTTSGCRVRIQEIELTPLPIK
jgi:hypothetical protein